MSIRLLGGMAKGFTIEVPFTNKVRPTSILLKRKVFDRYQILQSKIFVDCCAGSGAVGLEAWSRGAKKVFFIESSSKTCSIISKNIRKMELAFLEEVSQRNLAIENIKIEKWPSLFRSRYLHWEAADQENTIIFFDPPYFMKELYESFLSEMNHENWFKGTLWVESDEQEGFPFNELKKFGKEPQNFYRQGERYIAIIDFGT